MLQEAYVMDVEGGSARLSASRPPSEAEVPSWAESPAYLRLADLLMVLTAGALPWSTTLTSVLMLVWLVMVIPTIDWDELIRSLALPACALPLALFALADIGVLWSDAPWEAGVRAINPMSKLLLIPFLFHHYRRSERAGWVFVGFFVSSMLLTMLSWIASIDPANLPGLQIIPGLDQHQPFALCALALAAPAAVACTRGRVWTAAGLIGLALLFLAHDLLVVPARATCVAMTMLLLVLVHHVGRRTTVLLLAAAVAGGVAWAASPTLSRPIVDLVARDHASAANVAPIERLHHWRRSIASIGEAPLLGHGTGAIRAPSASDSTGAPEMPGAARDPQSLSLAVALQWGLTGLIALYTMWLSHIRLVRGGDWIAWVGLAVIVQTFVGSLLSFDPFDVDAGWIYVIGVGVAGGVALGGGRGPARPDKVLPTDCSA